MAGKLRLEFPGAVYHVVNRGNYRRDVLAAEMTKAAFERCLFQACERSDPGPASARPATTQAVFLGIEHGGRSPTGQSNPFGIPVKPLPRALDWAKFD